MATTLVNRVPTASRGRRFGRPQVLAGCFLLVFLVQGLWLANRVPMSQLEASYAGPGQSANSQFPSVQSPFTKSAANATRPFSGLTILPRFLPRLPFLAVGVLLGASLWFVARRLYGNAGGYIALWLYCFSPTLIAYSARVSPEIAAAWGVFGCVFTAIAVAHTLYAPREVILWNWKRILLLGIAIGLGTGAQLSTALVIPIVLALMLYLAPDRRPAAFIILAASCVLGAGLLWAFHGFSISAMANVIRNAGFGQFSFAPFSSRIVWHMLAILILQNGPGFALMLSISIVTFALWPRTRFFGTEAPLLLAVAMVCFGLALPDAAGFSFLVVALPFLFVFVAGIFADLLQSRWAPFLLGITLACLAINAYFSLNGLWNMR